jgi:uncharacterized protein YecE (DUF72 family)
MKRSNLLRIGTSSFSEADWVGPFYPAGTRPAEYLKYYATRFDTVEIDASYYAIPRRRAVEAWAKNTPNGFLISAKFPRSIVHGGDGPRPDPRVVLVPDRTFGDRDRFLEAMSALGPRLGPLVLQFPYFSKEAFSSSAMFFDRLDHFLESLPIGFRYAVEIRNRAWLKPALGNLLKKHGAALVLVDQAWMPHGDEVAKMIDPVTTGFAYIRLLGDRKEIEAVTDRWDRIVIDRTERLMRWAAVIRQFLDNGLETMVYANNHYAGYAPDTAETLREMIDNRRDS